MNSYDTPAGELLSDVSDFLAGMETVLHTASITERIEIENAARIVYNESGEEEVYQAIIAQVATLRERIFNHLES